MRYSFCPQEKILMVQPRSRVFGAIVAAGMLCGVLDITAAFVTWMPQGVSPVIILKGIASGMLGASAFNGGAGTAVLGLALHFLIALSAATVFYVSSRRLTWLVRRPFLSGPLYGIAVYLVMYWIVLPLSNFHKRPFSVTAATIAVVTHIFCVGLPIALVTSQFE